MSDIIHMARNAYQFGSAFELTPHHADRLIEQFATADNAGVRSVLGGRRSVSITTLEGIGRVVVKHYHRGGLLARLNKQTYMRTGKHRCRIEFEQMAHARSLGVQTPEPVAYAYRGGVFYRGWLVTKAVEDQLSLAVLSVEAPARAEQAMRALAAQVAVLIEHKILHVDFHPGNVLVDHQDQIYIIDFDKAHTFAGSRRKLKERYAQRWQRAIQKHQLPHMLDELMGQLH